MPSITVNIPEAKGDQLQKSLLKEFDRLRKEMQGLKDTDHSEEILKSLLKQQDSLVKAMERLFQRVTKMPSASDGLGSVMKDLKQSLSGLGDDLKNAMVRAMKSKSNGTGHTMRPRVTVNPEVTVNFGGLGKRLDKMEDAILKNGSRSRNRTFGSNY